MCLIKIMGMISAKLYCCIMCMYESVTTNPNIMYNYNVLAKIFGSGVGETII